MRGRWNASEIGFLFLWLFAWSPFVAFAIDRWLF